MPENLILRLVDGQLDWLLLDDSGSEVRLRGRGTFDEFKDLIADIHWQGDTRLLIGGEHVLLTHANIPSKQQRQIVQAVPFAVEEQLADDIDDCHFALGKRIADNSLEVLIVNRIWFEQQLRSLREIDLEPIFVGVDFLMIPHGDGTNILIDGMRAHILTSGMSGLTTDIKHLAMTLALMEDSDQEHIEIYVSPEEREPVNLAISEIDAFEATELTIHELPHRGFEEICRHVDLGSVNLLQGEFKTQTKKSSKGSGWKSVAVLAACAFFAHLLLTLGQAIFLDMQTDRYAEEARALYKEVFPTDRNVRDIRRRWAGHLRGGNSSDGKSFMSMFEEAAANIPGSSLTVQNINYNESRGDLILQLEAPRSEQLVLFAESLSRVGLQAEIGTISQDEDSVRGSIKIQSFGGS